MPEDKTRRVILLQGPSSLFFRDLGLALRRWQAEVLRVGFTPADRVYWSSCAGRYLNYTEPAEEFSQWFTDVCERYNPSDLIMLGDGRFYHNRAIAVARALQSSPRLWIVEHGYLRPGLISVDPDGLGSNSRLREKFAEHSRFPLANDTARPKGASFTKYALLDLGYHASSLALGSLTNPHYVRPSLDHPLKEYSGWALKAATHPIRRLLRYRTEKRIAQSTTQLRFLYPLQLANDFLVRVHGCDTTMEETLDKVISSFANHAPKTSLLTIKRHPLDNGWTPWRRMIRDRARHYSISSRVAYLDGGDFETMVKKVDGVVTINSTAGLTALLAGVPCHCLGTAIYDIPGLTSQLALDAFWNERPLPNPDLLKAFQSFLLKEYHLPGTFDGPGAQVGAENLAKRICQNRHDWVETEKLHAN